MNTHLESALLYTMSTVAQTLAAAIGLLGAIVLFALQATGRSVERAARRLSEVPHETLSELYIRHLVSRRSYNELAKQYGELMQPSKEMSANMLVYHSALLWELKHELAIRRSFWISLLASALVIAYALGCLALAPQIATHPGAGTIVLDLAVVGTIACLVLFGIMMRVVLRMAPEEPL